MAQCTYIELFERGHPIYETDEKAKLEKAQSGGSSTTVLKQPPLKMLTELPYMYWVGPADTFLLKQKSRTDIELTTCKAPPQIASGVDKEADVVTIAGENLITPLMVAIKHIYPQLTRYAEVNLDKLRADCIFKTRTQQNNSVVMVVEYKRCWYIHDDQFRKAFKPLSQVDKIAKEMIAKGVETTLARGSNALFFIKQATAYYQISKCRYIALCDYEHLILIKYRTWYDLRSADVTIVPRDLMLKALLGFLLEACEVAGLQSI
jgi:hypothetical protein